MQVSSNFAGCGNTTKVLGVKSSSFVKEDNFERKRGIGSFPDMKLFFSLSLSSSLANATDQVW
jgi:hypothetical protein